MNLIAKNIPKIVVFLGLFLFYLLISANSILPENSFYSSGDVAQIFNFENFSYKRNSVWENLQAGRINNNYFSNFYYDIIFFIINVFNFPANYLTFFLKFTYLFFSFLSFYFSLNILRLNINFYSKILLSISYSINFFTFYIFWYTWGYSTNIFYYIFVPILFSSSIYFTYEIDVKKKLKFLLNLTPFLLLSNLAFANLSWIIISIIIFTFVTLYKIMTFNLKNIIYKSIFKEIIFFSIFLFVFIIFSLGSIFLQLQSINENIDVLDLNSLYNWITSQSQILPSGFFFIQHYKYIDTMNGLQFFSIFNFFIIFYLLWKNLVFVKYVKFFLIFIIFIIFITFKGVPFFPEFITKSIFFDTLFYAFRSEDKQSLLLAYCLLTLVALLVINKKNQTKIASIVVILNLLSAYPLITGGVNYDHGINISKNKITEFESIKKINEDLLKFQELTNLDIDKDLYNIIEVPFFVTRSPGWYELSNFNHLGVSFFENFTKMQIFSFNDNQETLGKKIIPYWSSKEQNTDWDINILNILSAKYILNHKTAPKTKFNNTNIKLQDFENKKIITKIYLGKDIDLYKVNEKYLNKKIYIPDLVVEDCILEYNSDYVLESKPIKPKTGFVGNKCSLDMSIFKKIDKKTSENIIYTKSVGSNLNNIIFDEEVKKYKFEGINLNKNFFIIFTQTFNSFWELKCHNCDKNQRIKHIKINNSFNGWIVDNNNMNKLEFSIYFKLEEYFKIYMFFLIGITLFSLWIRKQF